MGRTGGTGRTGGMACAVLAIPPIPPVLPDPVRLIDRAGAGPSRVAAGSAWTDGSCCRGMRERLGRRARLRGEHRQELLQVDAGAGRTAGRLTFACQVLEMMAAAAAFVFEKRHRLL